MPVTILELAIHMGLEPRPESEGGGYSAAQFEALGLPFMGGCQACGATIAAFNACPSKTGFLRCRGSGPSGEDGCTGDLGYETAAEAEQALFGEEEPSYWYEAPKECGECHLPSRELIFEQEVNGGRGGWICPDCDAMHLKCPGHQRGKYHPEKCKLCGFPMPQ